MLDIEILNIITINCNVIVLKKQGCQLQYTDITQGAGSEQHYTYTR